MRLYIAYSQLVIKVKQMKVTLLTPARDTLDTLDTFDAYIYVIPTPLPGQHIFELFLKFSLTLFVN